MMRSQPNVKKQNNMLPKCWMKFLYTNKLDLPPVIAVEVWKDRVFDVGGQLIDRWITNGSL